jgi:hypothetical protein
MDSPTASFWLIREQEKRNSPTRKGAVQVTDVVCVVQYPNRLSDFVYPSLLVPDRDNVFIYEKNGASICVADWGTGGWQG